MPQYMKIAENQDFNLERLSLHTLSLVSVDAIDFSNFVPYLDFVLSA